MFSRGIYNLTRSNISRLTQLSTLRYVSTTANSVAQRWSPPAVSATEIHQNTFATRLPFSFEEKTEHQVVRQVSELSNPCTNGKFADGSFLSPCGGHIGVADASPLHSSVSTIFNDLSCSSQTFLDHVFALLHRHPTLPLAKAVEVTSSSHGNPPIQLCVVRCDSMKLQAVCVGAAGFAVVRGKEVIYSSVEDLEDEDQFEKYCDGMAIEMDIQPGDRVVVASDGFFDNLFEDEIESVVAHSTPEQLASNLAGSAMASACSYTKATPFSERMNEQTDLIQAGGKPDDITVIVSTPSN